MDREKIATVGSNPHYFLCSTLPENHFGMESNIGEILASERTQTLQQEGVGFTRIRVNNTLTGNSMGIPVLYCSNTIHSFCLTLNQILEIVIKSVQLRY